MIGRPRLIHEIKTFFKVMIFNEKVYIWFVDEFVVMFYGFLKDAF